MKVVSILLTDGLTDLVSNCTLKVTSSGDLLVYSQGELLKAYARGYWLEAEILEEESSSLKYLGRPAEC